MLTSGLIKPIEEEKSTSKEDFILYEYVKPDLSVSAESTYQFIAFLNFGAQFHPNEKKIDLVIKDFVIDPYSIELLKMGKKGQRYVINDFLDEETGIVYRYFTPSVIKGFINSEALIKDAGFKPEDVCEGTQIAPGSGIVHDNAKQVILKRHKDNLKTTHSHLLTKYMMGGSSINYTTFIGRSTNNWEVIKLKKLWEFAFYFYDHYSFRAEYDKTIRYLLARSLPWLVIEMGMLKTLQILEKSGIKIENVEDIVKLSKKVCYSLGFDAIVKKIQKNKKVVAQLLMHTIYVASGIIDEGYPKFINPDSIIKDTLQTAKEEKIPLDLERIPVSFTDTKGATALLHGAKQLCDSTLKMMLDAGADFKARDVDNNGILHYAAQNPQSSAVCLMLTCTEDLASKNKVEDTPLHIAVAVNNFSAIQAFIHYKSFFTAFIQKNLAEDTPLNLALQQKDGNIINYVIQNASSEGLEILAKEMPKTSPFMKIIQDKLSSKQEKDLSVPFKLKMV